jgi:hypothetical protein
MTRSTFLPRAEVLLPIIAKAGKTNKFMGTGGRVTAVAVNGLVIRAILSSSLLHETHRIRNNVRYKVL